MKQKHLMGLLGIILILGIGALAFKVYAPARRAEPLGAPVVTLSVGAARQGSMARASPRVSEQDPHPPAGRPEVFEDSRPAAPPAAPSAVRSGKRRRAGDAGPPTSPTTVVARPPADSSEVPLPRVALSFVGADPEAEAVWAQAINDPGVAAETRKDLIEDLNEDGFPDPHNVTPDDLPLIVSRLQLIEQLAPEAMDDVNAAAFQEAYKDLANMFNRVTR